MYAFLPRDEHLWLIVIGRCLTNLARSSKNVNSVSNLHFFVVVLVTTTTIWSVFSPIQLSPFTFSRSKSKSLFPSPQNFLKINFSLSPSPFPNPLFPHSLLNPSPQQQKKAYRPFRIIFEFLLEPYRPSLLFKYYFLPKLYSTLHFTLHCNRLIFNLLVCIHIHFALISIICYFKIQSIFSRSRKQSFGIL